MSRIRIRDIRHEELVEAAIAATHAEGYATVTMTEIARAAGTTAASINYYFGSKEKLMEATMRSLLTKLRTALVARLANTETPQERLHAIVTANFDNTLFSPAQCSFWVQFWANAPYSPRLTRLHRINRHRVTSHLRRELRALVRDEDRAALQLSLQAYMDGVWVEAAQADGAPDAAEAQRNAAAVIDALLIASQAN